MFTEKHSPGIAIISSARLIERFCYYGVRSILFLYLVQGPLALTREKSSEIYALFNLLLFMTPLAGGLLADLIAGVRHSIWIGGFIQALGFFLIAVPSIPFLYTGIALVALGSGIYGPSSMSAIGHLYASRPSKLNSAVYIFYVAINLGAFLGPLIIGFFFEQYAAIGFILCGLVLCLSQLFILLGGSNLNEVPNTASIHLKNPNLYNRTPDLGIGALICMMFLVPLFWLCYETASNFMYEMMSSSNHQNILFRFLPNLSTIVVVLLGILLAIIFSVFRSSATLKITIGFFLAAISSAMMNFSSGVEEESGMVLIFVLAQCVMGIAEILVVASAQTIILRFSPPQFKTLIISCSLILTTGLFQIPILLFGKGIAPPVLFCILLLFCGGIVALAFYLVNRNKADRISDF
jgi:POT family proton-dependent oligopeptide transporter